MTEITAAVPRLTIHPAVVCEDIRQEATGKYILIGVYPADIVLPQFPSQINLAIWIPILADSLGQLKLDLRVLSPANATLAQLTADVHITIIGRGGLATPVVPIQIQEAGALKIQAKQEGSDWQTIVEFVARLAPVVAQPT